MLKTKQQLAIKLDNRLNKEVCKITRIKNVTCNHNCYIKTSELFLKNYPILRCNECNKNYILSKSYRIINILILIVCLIFVFYFPAPNQANTTQFSIKICLIILAYLSRLLIKIFGSYTEDK